MTVYPMIQKPRDLRESLEQFAARHGGTPDEVRFVWRAQGAMRLTRNLSRDLSEIDAGMQTLCRIAPGVPICPERPCVIVREDEEGVL